MEISAAQAGALSAELDCVLTLEQVAMRARAESAVLAVALLQPAVCCELWAELAELAGPAVSVAREDQLPPLQSQQLAALAALAVLARQVGRVLVFPQLESAS
jgi:hypothetical protein